MAKRIAAEEVLVVTRQQRPLRSPVEDAASDLEVDPRTKSHIVKLAAHLAEHPRGLSFAALRTASALATKDVRSALEAARRAGLIRRSGVKNQLLYLVNLPASPV